VVGDILLGQDADLVVNGVSGNVGLIRGEVDLGAGDDRFDGQFGRLIGSAFGGEGDDFLRGGRGDDHLNGDVTGGLTGGADQLVGLRGDDSLDGQAGDDVVNGGKGGDLLTGGAGADIFVYARAGDSIDGGSDLITDLDSADIIDLSRIDAEQSGRGDVSNEAFHIVLAFSNAAGELTVSYDALGDLTTIAGDVDGDGTADLVITASGDHAGFASFVL